MNELISTELWPRLKALAKHAKRKHAAIAYVTDDTKIRFGKNDVLVTDASDEAIKSGQTSAEVLRAAFERKAEIGDKLGLIARACSWLNHEGLFVANLDCGNLRLNPGGTTSRAFAKELRQAGVDYLTNKRLVRCEGHRRLSLPFDYVVADDDAGPNYTKQPVVNSYYVRRL